ncbi:hypothetical protein PhCBS80983_g02282 [Powellomyces hirtus]|uniref:Uncharacterized protein n=1 Tax=Powellomyces hirtus TaxID=109895 RepID=A0A507E8P8_9FUNG|nr:hypothetical protein PhCBS80983_g02282 [Powellomyces hirtus]
MLCSTDHSTTTRNHLVPYGGSTPPTSFCFKTLPTAAILATFRLGWSCPAFGSASERSFQWTAADNDLGVVVSSAKSVEDLRRDGSQTKRRNRLVRHRAQKRSRKANAVFVPAPQPTAEQTVEFPSLPRASQIATIPEVHTPSYKQALEAVRIIESVPYIHVAQRVKKISHAQRRPITSAARYRVSFFPVTAKHNIAVSAAPRSSGVSNITRPLVDLCRDRRRRVTGIKRTSTVPTSRKYIAQHLSNSYQNGGHKTHLMLVPTWAKFSLHWDCHPVA